MFFLFAILSLSVIDVEDLIDVDLLDEIGDDAMTTSGISDISPDPPTPPTPEPTPESPVIIVSKENATDVEKYIKDNAETTNLFNFSIQDDAVLNIPNGTGITYDITGTTFEVKFAEVPSFLNVHDCTSITIKSDLVFPQAAFKTSQGNVEITIKNLSLDISNCKATAKSTVTETLDVFNTTEITEFAIPYVTNQTTVKASASHFVVFMNSIYIKGKLLIFMESATVQAQPKVIKPYDFGKTLTLQLSTENQTRQVASEETVYSKPNIEVEGIEESGQIHVLAHTAGTNNATILLKSAAGRFILSARTEATISLGENVKAVVSTTTLSNIPGYQTQTGGTYLIGTQIDGSDITEITYVTGGIKINDTFYSNVKIYNQNGASNQLTLKYESGDLDCGLEFVNNSKVYFDASFSKATGKKLEVTAEKGQKATFDKADGVDLDALLEIKDSNGDSIPLSDFTDTPEDDNKKLLLMLIIIGAVVVVVIIIVIILCCCCGNKKKKDISSSSMESQSEDEDKRSKLKNRPPPNTAGKRKLTVNNYRRNAGSSSSSDSDSDSSSSSDRKHKKSNKSRYHH